MKRLTTWDPFKELDMFQDRLSGLFGYGPRRLTDASGELTPTAESWRPLVDIVEAEKEFQITAEIPEVKKEDVKVTVENGVLRISGERKIEKEEKDKKFHRIERSYGRFERSFSLAEKVDAGMIKADFKDGLLKIRVPKIETPEKKAIEVKVS